MRFLEDVYFGATWSNIVHIQINQMSQSPPTLGFNATVALTGLHNNNGLGNAASHDDIAIGCATSGTLHIGRATGDTAPGIRVLESIPIDSAIDNPSFFKDAYATPEDDSSGYVLAGLSRAVDLPKTAKDPSKTEPIMAWLVQRTTAPGQEADRLKQGSGWERKLLFEDDGTRIRSASAAVMVGIDPKLEAGKKRAWLFVTGFSSANVHAVKVDL